MAESPAHGPPRIFQVGFRKCGTTALAAFLDRCGIPCIHHDGCRLAIRMRENLARGARPLDGYEHYRAFANMDLVEADDVFDGFREHRALDAAYGGRFILNTRPFAHWLASATAQDRARGVWEGQALRRFGTADPDRVAAGWRALWDDQHRAVRADIAPERLLVFDIESDPPERLCDFVGVPRGHARYWRLENPSLGVLGRAAARLAPGALKRAVPSRLKAPAKRWLRARR